MTGGDPRLSFITIFSPLTLSPLPGGERESLGETKDSPAGPLHGVSFEAVYDFDWSGATIERDDRADYGEERLVALGYIRRRLYSLVFTGRGPKVRVISLRKANERERSTYAEKR